jgi:hypothetical protein
MTTIKMFNGGGVDRRNPKTRAWEPVGHYYIGAFSKAEAVALMRLAGFEYYSLHELNEYASKGCWGNQMRGVLLQRGVWIVPPGREWDNNFTPVRVR